MYHERDGEWEQVGADLHGSATGDHFGWSVSLSTNATVLAVVATPVDGVNGPNSGRVIVYSWSGSVWQNMGPPIDGDAAYDVFGTSIALSGDGTILAAGAWGNDARGDSAGCVQVFAWNGTNWNQRGQDLDGSFAGDAFGTAVALSSDGSVVACGAPRFYSEIPGYVRIYGWNGSTWMQRGSQQTGFRAHDYFGESISLSRDGRVLAVGAGNGNYVVVYRNDGTDWFKIGQTIFALAFNDQFGESIALSLDGETVIIGAWLNDSNGFASGHALVYRLSPTRQVWVPVGQERRKATDMVSRCLFRTMVGELPWERFSMTETEVTLEAYECLQ